MDRHDLSRAGEAPHPDRRPDVAPGTIVIYSDLSCAFAHVCVHRLLAARERAGYDVRLVHRPFLLEEVNRFPIPKHFLDSEIPVIAGLDPDAGWSVFHDLPETWPLSTLLAMEAVRAAEAQSPQAHEQLDRALRLAFFRDHHCITLRHVIVDLAASCPDVDADRLADDLDRGTARRALIDDHRDALNFVQGSPHVFLADGTALHNPGVEVTWPGKQGEAYPQARLVNPEIHDELLARAAS